MGYFRFKLLSPSGRVFSGFIKLPYLDEMSAISHLERDGSTAIHVSKPGIIYSFLLHLASFSLQQKMSRSDQAEFLSNMSLMLRSGVPISSALKESSTTSSLPEISKDIEDMIISIQGGLTFSETASKYSHIFPKAILHLIRIGEETGQLDEMLKKGAGHLKRIDGIVSDTKQALLYPSFVFFMLGAGLIFWFYFVVPKIVTLFVEMNVSLPGLTVFLIWLSEVFQNYLFHILGGLAVAIMILSYLYKGSPVGRRIIETVLLNLPLSGTIIRASSLAFITEYLSLLLSSGIDILQSLKILKESITNSIYKESLDNILGSVSRGDGIAGSFKNAQLFPPFVIRMIGIGEMSGTLTEQLAYISEEYKNKLSLLVSTIGKIIEPVVLIIAGIMFAIIIGGLLLPIYDLVSQISK